VCVRFALCMSAIDSLQTHTHTHARLRIHSHIQTMMGREAHREGGWKNDDDKREREKEDHLIYWRTR
jgi:hypothetical protein